MLFPEVTSTMYLPKKAHKTKTRQMEITIPCCLSPAFVGHHQHLRIWRSRMERGVFSGLTWKQDANSCKICLEEKWELIGSEVWNYVSLYSTIRRAGKKERQVINHSRENSWSTMKYLSMSWLLQECWRTLWAFPHAIPARTQYWDANPWRWHFSQTLVLWFPWGVH